MLGEIKCDGGAQFAGVLREELLDAVGDPMLSMMELRKEDLDPSGVAALPMLVASVKFKNNPKVRFATYTGFFFSLGRGGKNAVIKGVVGACPTEIRTFDIAIKNKKVPTIL